MASKGNPPRMVADAKKSPDKKLFRFSDLALTCGFVLLGIFLTYVVILLLGMGESSTLPRQFLEP
jgi:hypothetical protein